MIVTIYKADNTWLVSYGAHVPIVCRTKTELIKAIRRVTKWKA